MKERNIGIDILKFLAVLLITNSHMELLYGKYDFLATGGTIGDALFLFCSGYTLFMKPTGGLRAFPDWYKRRINRIYPTVLAMAIVNCVFFHSHPDILQIILYGGGWFVSCIMLYYLLVYFIVLYGKDRLDWVILLVGIASCIWFYCMDRSPGFNMYDFEGGRLKWLLYFVFMLLGARLGLAKTRFEDHSLRDLLLGVLGIVLFYAVYVAGMKVEPLGWIQVFNFIPLLFAIYHLFLWGNGRMARKIYENRTCHFLIRFVSGLCLEIYLIQGPLFTDKLNGIFPLNLVIVFVVIVVAAYLVRCLARWISQTFKDAPYDWRKIVSLF